MTHTGSTLPPTPTDSTLLLVWDGPNIDFGLGSLLNSRPGPDHRPRFDALGRWLLRRAEGEGLHVEACVFTNVAPDGGQRISSWVEALRNMGYYLFAKPKTNDDSDVDPDMLEHIERRRADGVLRHIVVASADGANFKDTLEDLAGDIPVEVIGFRELAHWAVTSESLGFVDLEDIPGLFRTPLPRVSLDRLPDGGAWLHPYRSLAASISREDEPTDRTGDAAGVES